MYDKDAIKDLFLQYYAKYYEAKEQQYPRLTWLYAVYCRAEIQKLALLPHKAPKDEEDVFQKIFEEQMLSKEPIKHLYSELCHDSKPPSSWN
jgi:hypothetical protein